MAKAISRSNLLLVELETGVLAKTSIPSENHAALRAGFAGYTSNPRWCASKFVAWRTGRAWRSALESGQLAVRQSDLMLVPAEEAAPQPTPEVPRKEGLLKSLKNRSSNRSGRLHEAPQMQQA